MADPSSKVTAPEAAELLGLAAEELGELVSLRFLMPKAYTNGVELFARADLERLKPEELELARSQAALARSKATGTESRRRHPRVPLVAKVEIRTLGTEHFVSEFTGNISLGGIFIETAQALPPGSAVLLSVVDRSSGAQILEARGTVAWSRPAPGAEPAQRAGMGIEFTWLSDEGRAVVSAMVERTTGR